MVWWSRSMLRLLALDFMTGLWTGAVPPPSSCSSGTSCQSTTRRPYNWSRGGLEILQAQRSKCRSQVALDGVADVAVPVGADLRRFLCREPIIKQKVWHQKFCWLDVLVVVHLTEHISQRALGRLLGLETTPLQALARAIGTTGKVSAEVPREVAPRTV